MNRARFVAIVLLLATLASGTFAQTTKVSQPQERFCDAVLANFAAWDTDGNGVLDDAELSHAVQDSNIRGDAAAAVAALKSALKAKKAPTFPTWNRDYFKGDDASIQYLVRGFRAAESRLRNTPGELMERPSLALRECKQGSLGDCYLVAATGAAINRDPLIVSKMLTMTPDHTAYLVKYPDGEEVRVPALTEGEIAMGGAATKNGLWLRILEKAWGVRKINGSKRIDPTAEPIDAMGHGGSIRSTLEAMTGHKALSFRLGNTRQGANVTPDRLRQELTEATKDHRLIGAATPSVVTVPGISPNHAYAILGFEADSDRINIWNPHVNRFTPKDAPGLTTGYTTSEGMFSMPLTEFIATFSGVSIESPTPAASPQIAK